MGDLTLTKEIEVKPLPSPAYESIARMVYFVWLYLHAFLRMHGIELALLLIIALSLAAPAYRFVGWKLKAKQ